VNAVVVLGHVNAVVRRPARAGCWRADGVSKQFKAVLEGEPSSLIAELRANHPDSVDGSGQAPSKARSFLIDLVRQYLLDCSAPG